MRRTARPLRVPVQVRPSTAGECERVHLTANPIRVMRSRVSWPRPGKAPPNLGAQDRPGPTPTIVSDLRVRIEANR